MRIGLRVAEPTELTVIDATTRRVTKTKAASPTAPIAAEELTISDWAVRPTSRGPVHPKPASKNPNP